MNLNSWLAGLSFNRHADRSMQFHHIQLMLERLNLLPLKSIVISIAGTNGKGSCAAFLESIYSQAGYRVGTFTSPHLLVFNERIRLCQKNASDEVICDAFSQLEKARGDLKIGYFQFTFLAALIIFQKANLDIILLEVGIGGLYDAVNTVDADLSIITQIGLDHCDILGNSRELIAQQKAGIMRQGKPVVCGDYDPPSTLFEIVDKLQSKLFRVNKDYSFEKKKVDWSWCCADKILSHIPIPHLLTRNAATVLMAVECLQAELPVVEEAIRKGVQEVQLLGRQQLIKYKNISILFDVAHNPDAMFLLAEKIKKLKFQGKKRVIFGVMKDKDVRGMIQALNADIDYWYFVSLQYDRSVSANSLMEILAEFDIAKGQTYSAPFDALNEAISQSNTEDLIVICGSFLTVAGVLERISGNIMNSEIFSEVKK